MTVASPVRARLKPEERRRHILDVAAELVVEQGAFPISFELLGQRMGISKALVYSYFPTQYDLANGLLALRFEALTANGLDEAIGLADWRAAAQSCGDIYFDEAVAHGPLVHILLADLFLAGHLSDALTARYRHWMGRLARRMRAIAGLGARDAVAAVQMISAVPEEAGMLARQGRITRQNGKRVAREMTIGAVEGFLAARQT